jgi:Tfp pilus assembly protein PilN
MRYLFLTIVVVLASALFAGALYYWLTIKVEKQDELLASNNTQILSAGAQGTALLGLMKAKNDLEERGSAYERLSTRRELNVDLLADFSLLIPKNVWLTELAYTQKDHKMKVTGKATSAQAVSDFVENLVSSTKFAHVQQRSLVQDTQNPSIFDFSLDCSLARSSSDG